MSAAPGTSPGLVKRLARTATRWSLPVIVLVTAAGIWQRERIWVWYCTERLERATNDNRAERAAKLAALGEPALPSALGLLRRDDVDACAGGKIALEKMLANWPVGDPRRQALVAQFFAAEPGWSDPGRTQAVNLLPDLLKESNVELRALARDMLAAVARSTSLDLRLHTIATALRLEVNCLEAIVPLIDDPAVEVRRAAIVALANARAGDTPLVGDDALLRRLHDSDADVVQFAEMGLRGRGRTPREIRLGKLYAAPTAGDRQKLLNDLAIEDDLDVAVWLERLTNDADPAVRAGAARVAFERRTELRGRLEQMSRDDPDATVRQIADYYRRKMLAAR